MIGTQYLEWKSGNTVESYPWMDGSENPYNVKRKGKAGDLLQTSKEDVVTNVEIAGNQRNDGEIIPTNVYWICSKWLCLYHMADNMNEWGQGYLSSAFHSQDFDDLTQLEYRVLMKLIRMRPSVNLTDELRVYKAVSWRDVTLLVSSWYTKIYDQDSATDDIGFQMCDEFQLEKRKVFS